MSNSGSISTNRKLRLVWVACAAGIILLVALVATLWSLKGKRFNIQFTQQELQANLDARFPVEKQYLLVFKLALSDPVVELQTGSDRITFGTKATVSILIGGQSKPLGGTAKITTGLRYEAIDHSFYLHDPQLTELNVQGIPLQFVDKVNGLARELLQEAVNRAPIYTLKSDELAPSTARIILKELFVDDGKLNIVLGL